MPPRETLEWYPGCLETPHGKGRGLLQAPFNSWDGSAGAAFRSSASFPAGMPLLLAWDAKHLPKGYKEPSLPCATLWAPFGMEGGCCAQMRSCCAAPLRMTFPRTGAMKAATPHPGGNRNQPRRFGWSLFLTSTTGVWQCQLKAIPPYR